MKKFTILCLAGCLLTVLSCKKNKDQVPATTNDIKTIADLADRLRTETGLSVFTNVLKQTAITTEDINSGVTVLAVPDAAFVKTASLARMTMATAVSIANNPNNYSDTVSSPSLTTVNIKDQIIKGVINFSQIQSGERLKSISGKIIQVIKSNDSIWLNGLLMEKKALLQSDKAIVYELPRSLTNTHPRGTISIAVYNATQWAADKPQGAPLPDYPVYLFRTQEDYAATRSNGTPQYAYMVKTDATGNALFTDVLPGNYYLSAGMFNNTDTLFAEFRTKQLNNLLIGLSSDTLIQSAPPPSQPHDLPGTFIWPDTNGDGKIDDNDLQTLPLRSVQTSDEGTVASRILVGKEATFNLNTIDQQVNIMYGNFGSFTVNRVMADGYMSQDAIASPADGLAHFNDFTITPSLSYITNIWDRGWSAIYTANWIIDALNHHSGIENTASYIAQAKLVRGISYLQLVTYFGDVPLLNENNFSTDLTPLRKPQSAILDFALQDLNDAANALPNGVAGKSSPDRWAAYAALARVYLLKKDYTNAKLTSDKIINTGTYALTSGSEDVFQSAGNSEQLWAVSNQYLGSIFMTYFYGRPVFPYIRYAEVLLINAEANIYLNDLTRAQAMLNMLQLRSGKPFVQLSTATSKEVFYTVLKAEMPREGVHFAALQRLGLAAQQLSAKGYKSYNSVLPLPLSALNQNPNLVQNPGY
ncbi:MAG TPA: RagB/SusD family nutrient uptake outer membrane protein [Niabella sp.]